LFVKPITTRAGCAARRDVPPLGTDAASSEARGEHYIILSPSEVAELSDEVEASINVPMPWQFPHVDPELTKEFLLGPLAEVVKSSRWGAMWWAQ